MRTDVVTIDASLVAKLFLEEPDSPAFRGWYRAMQYHGVEFRAPNLLAYELGNIIGDEFPDKDEGTRAQILESALTGILLQDTELDQPFRFMAKPKITYYDAAYVADGCASGSIASADERMRRAAANTGKRTRIWTPELQAAAAAPSFVTWLRAHDGQDPTGDVSREIRADPSARNLETFLDVWRHMESVRASDSALEALDLSLTKFVAVNKAMPR